MRITVIGTGYLGAVHAAGMAALGHDVLGVDTDERRIAALAVGDAPFFEPGLPELLRAGVDSGRLSFTSSLAEAARFGDVHFVCVGTPQLPGGEGADLRYVDAVVAGLVEHADHDALVVGKSTVPVGTARRVGALLAEARHARLGVAWNPEFLREGFAVEDTLSPDRLVFGTTDVDDELVLRTVYERAIAADTPVVATDLETSELVKVAANSFLATKISFINAMAEVCEAAGADVTTLADAIGHDGRIGRRFLNAGVGFGGGCLGKDIRAFRSRADELGVGHALGFLAEVDAVNDRRRARAADLAVEVAGGEARGRRIAVLGAAFKPNSDDVRDSPALAVAGDLAERGARVIVHDPEASANARRALPGVDHTDDLDAAVRDADVLVLMTEWDEYRSLDPHTLAPLVSGRRIVDGRNALEADRWNSAGFDVHPLGRPASPAWHPASPLTARRPDTQKEEQVA